MNIPDLYEGRERLFVKPCHYVEGNFGDDIDYTIWGDIIFITSVITVTNGEEIISEPVPLSLIGDMEPMPGGGMEEDPSWLFYALSVMHARSSVILEEVDGFEINPRDKVKIMYPISREAPIPHDKIMLYSNASFFNATSLLFLFDEYMCANDVAEEFDSDFYVLPVSPDFCYLISTENPNYTLKDLYSELDRLNEESRDILSEMVFIYSRDEEYFYPLERPIE